MKKIFAILLVGLFLLGCTGGNPQPPPLGQLQPPDQKPGQPPAAAYPNVTRESGIPADAVKMTPEMDIYPPQLHSDEWEAPVPLPAPINTRGAEDSGFMMPDGNAFYVFFTPDVRVPVERQVLDNLTGIYVSRKVGGQWTEPERVWLIEPGKLALDGCEFVQGNEMWFCSVRAGNLREVDLYTAELKNGKWTNWENAGEQINLEYQVGEMHISSDGNELFFHSGQLPAKGGIDIYSLKKVNGEWRPPQPVDAVNTPDNEGWPYISADGSELWFTRFYLGTPAIFKSEKIDGVWQEPELIVSQFAGEPTLDNEGNLYFTHHFYENGTMIEADIYVAYKK